MRKGCPECPCGERTVYAAGAEEDVIFYRSSGCTPDPVLGTVAAVAAAAAAAGGTISSNLDLSRDSNVRLSRSKTTIAATSKHSAFNAMSNPPSSSSSGHGNGNNSACVLWAATRNISSPANRWSYPVPTKIPDLQSNINAGRLHNGQAFLVSNLVPRPAYVHGPCALQRVLAACAGIHTDNQTELILD